MKKLNVWALAVAIVKAIGPLVRSMGKDSPGGKKITPGEVDELIGGLLVAAEDFLSEYME